MDVDEITEPISSDSKVPILDNPLKVLKEALTQYRERAGLRTQQGVAKRLVVSLTKFNQWMSLGEFPDRKYWDRLEKNGVISRGDLTRLLKEYRVWRGAQMACRNDVQQRIQKIEKHARDIRVLITKKDINDWTEAEKKQYELVSAILFLITERV